jgi:2-oxoglutarate ferredoxin oxidoreductase subunit beta
MEKIKAVPAMPESWRRETKAHKFCPGCGHGLILKYLGEIIDELEIAEKTVFVCDIGCSLLAWDFFNMDAVQTHHGRATPVATGIKRANPDLLTIAYMGDGGAYAIGSQHLVNAATRNEKMLVIVANNTNYAMTGGQMAPTTLPGQKTETTPYGRSVEAQGYPTKGAEMTAAITGQGAYVARGSIAKPAALKRYFRRALQNIMENKGFAFVEALSTCPTNWRTNNKETWAFLEKDMTDYYALGEYRVPEDAETAKEGK